MKSLFPSIICAVVVTVLPTGSVHAVGKDDPQDGFKQTAQKYEKLADKYAGMAKEAPDDKAEIYSQLAENYGEMATMKNAAAKAARRGTSDSVDWSEYESLAQQNSQLEAKLFGKHGGKKDKKSKKAYELEEKERKLQQELEKVQQQKKSYYLEEELKAIQQKKQDLEERERQLKEELNK